MQKAKNVEVVRERERELYSKEISFICDVIKIIKKYKSIEKINYAQKEKKKKLKLLRDSLSFFVMKNVISLIKYRVIYKYITVMLQKY